MNSTSNSELMWMLSELFEDEGMSANNSSSNPSQQNAALILRQFDQNTQLQALKLLRQLNAQQQMQQIQQIKQLQQLQTLRALQKLQLSDSNTNQNDCAQQDLACDLLSKVINKQQQVKERRILHSTAIVANNNALQQTLSNNNGIQISNNQLQVPKKKTSFSSAGSTSGASLMSSSDFSSSQRNSINSQQTSVNSQHNSVQQQILLSTSQYQSVKRQQGPDGELFIVPSEEMARQILSAAEFYFSDDNLAKDHYLLRQICQKSEGFLSIKLLTALKNVKRLTKDWRVTSYALERSTSLMLNDEKTKVKRMACLPEVVLRARQITNVIAIKIPVEFSSVSAITAMFAHFGKITLVRVLLPGRQVPCDLRNYATQVPDMGNTLCAVVEFDSETEACNACRELNGKRFPSGMRSALLGPRLRRNLYKVTPNGSIPPGFENDEMNFNENSGTNSIENNSENTNSGNSSTVMPEMNQISPLFGNWASKPVSGVLGSTSGRISIKKDSGCDTASHTSSSPQVFRKDSVGSVPEEDRKVFQSNIKASFDRAPGAGRKQVKLSINLSGNRIVRQPLGPTTPGSGFKMKRSLGMSLFELM